MVSWFLSKIKSGPHQQQNTDLRQPEWGGTAGLHPGILEDRWRLAHPFLRRRVPLALVHINDILKWEIYNKFFHACWLPLCNVSQCFPGTLQAVSFTASVKLPTLFMTSKLLSIKSSCMWTPHTHSLYLLNYASIVLRPVLRAVCRARDRILFLKSDIWSSFQIKSFTKQL